MITRRDKNRSPRGRRLIRPFDSARRSLPSVPSLPPRRCRGKQPQLRRRLCEGQVDRKVEEARVAIIGETTTYACTDF